MTIKQYFFKILLGEIIQNLTFVASFKEFKYILSNE
jgi:hypothetical protein